MRRGFPAPSRHAAITSMRGSHMRWLRRGAHARQGGAHAIVARSWLLFGVFLALLVAARSAAAQADLAVERARMVTTIEAHAKQASIALGRDSIAPEILKVVGDVPRHEFVPDGLRSDAYADRPLPIGYGQTISQPFIVALMTDLLRVGPNDAVLEIGTGSGYQAAVL